MVQRLPIGLVKSRYRKLSTTPTRYKSGPTADWPTILTEPEHHPLHELTQSKNLCAVESSGKRRRTLLLQPSPILRDAERSVPMLIRDSEENP